MHRAGDGAAGAHENDVIASRCRRHGPRHMGVLASTVIALDGDFLPVPWSGQIRASGSGMGNHRDHFRITQRQLAFVAGPSWQRGQPQGRDEQARTIHQNTELKLNIKLVLSQFTSLSRVTPEVPSEKNVLSVPASPSHDCLATVTVKWDERLKK